MKFCVTGGGTVAPIDDVRRIANFSTGRFAAEISEALLRRGGEVWHLRTPSALAPFGRDACLDLDAEDLAAEFARLTDLRERYRSVRASFHPRTLVEGTVKEYASTLRDILTTFPIDVVFHAAALSDYEPEATEGKLISGAGSMNLRCVPVPKVIRSVKDWAPSTYLVGFKLLSDVSRERLIEVARASNEANRADLTVANDFRTVREGRQTLHLVRPGREVETLTPGPDLAERLVDRVCLWVTKEGVEPQ